MAIKKTFVPLIEHLQANLKASVSDIIEEVVAMASTKSRGTGTGGASTTILKDAADNVVAIKDYYFKKWMPLVGPEAVEFGKKASAASGYSSMSKAGTSLWTKQQQEAKKAMTNILVEVEEGTLEVGDIAERKAEIEAERKVIQETDLGFDSLEDCKEYLADYCELADDTEAK